LVGVFTGVLIVAYAGVVTIWGVRLMAVGSMQLSPAMQINMAVVYAVFPLAGALMVWEGALAIVHRLRAGDES
jgi:TRAP-type C4-dicarboxylate transport system permease small subunit